MTEHADRIWAAAQVLNEVAETEDQSGAINDLLAVANALRSTPAAPLNENLRNLLESEPPYRGSSIDWMSPQEGHALGWSEAIAKCKEYLALRSTPAAPQSIRDALYDLRTHSHQPPNGADMPIEYVAFRDVEDLLSLDALPIDCDPRCKTRCAVEDPTAAPGYWCPFCPHAMYLHNEDGSCGCGMQCRALGEGVDRG